MIDMLLKPLHGSIAVLCIAMLLGLPAPAAEPADKDRSPDRPPPAGAHAASQCTEASRCPLFDEVYAATPAFRHALSLSLRHGDQVVPEWVKAKLPDRRQRGDTPPPTTASAMLPLRIDDRPYVLGRMTDPENPAHLIVALYDTQRGFATVHYVDKDGKAALLGDTTEILRKVMLDYVNAESAFARSLARPDVALPVPVTSH
ncbi:hypothetical protein ACKI2N_028505 [Cupriavidus sp. 30B13]|uniref:hypothetical protein n=1 Tax=Cupriavidus sp. 30B13 TaxID=3384241 RepID=UPI003B90789E